MFIPRNTICGEHLRQVDTPFLELMTQNEEAGFSLGWLQGQLLESLPVNLFPEDANTKKWLEGSLEGSPCG